MASAAAETCVICLSNFEESEETITLECAHRFHAKCINQWLVAKPACPICRTDIKQDRPVQETAQGTHDTEDTGPEWLDFENNIWSDFVVDDDILDSLDTTLQGWIHNLSTLSVITNFPTLATLEGTSDSHSERSSHTSTDVESGASREEDGEESGLESRIGHGTDSDSESASSHGDSSADSSTDDEVADSIEDGSSSSGSYSNSVPYRSSDLESDDTDSDSNVSYSNSDESDSGDSDCYNSASYSLGSCPSYSESYSRSYSFGYWDSDLESD